MHVFSGETEEEIAKMQLTCLCQVALINSTCSSEIVGQKNSIHFCYYNHSYTIFFRISAWCFIWIQFDVTALHLFNAGIILFLFCASLSFGCSR